MTEERPLRRLRPVGSRSGASREPYYNKSWAFVIGINDYGDRHPPLANARNDAEAVAKTLQETYHFDDVFALYDKEATHSSILEWLKDDLPTRTEPHDRLFFFFAGHGTTREGEGGYKRGYLIPQDAEPGKYSSFIDMSELRDACGWIRAKHILIVLDCCFSGVAAVTSRATPPATPGKLNDVYLQRITERSAWQVLTAGASDELVADSGVRPGHSAFTRALLAGLEGQADENKDGLITATELANYVKPEVIRESASGGAKGQTPFFNYLVGSGQGDFVFQMTERPHLAAVPDAVSSRSGTEQVRELRVRHELCKKVRGSWIDHVLEPSLYNGIYIRLNMEEHPDSVDNERWGIGLRQPTALDTKLPPNTEIVDVFDRFDQLLLILGEHGSGKTTTLLNLAKDLLDRSDADSINRIPVVFNLSSWSKRTQSLKAWLVDEFYARYKIDCKKATSFIENDSIVLLLDGLDEVQKPHRDACVESINHFHREHSVPMVVCSRVREYESLSIQLRFFEGAIVLQPLTSEQIDAYLEHAGTKLAALRTALNQDIELRRLAESPLLLRFMTLIYYGVSDVKQSVAGSKAMLRRRLFDDYIKSMFQYRESQPAYTPAKTLQWLHRLAKNQQGRTIINVELAWMNPGEERTTYYGILMLTTGIIGGIIGGLFGWAVNGLTGGLLGGILFALLYGLGFGLIFEFVMRLRYSHPHNLPKNVQTLISQARRGELFLGPMEGPVMELDWSWKKMKREGPTDGLLFGLAFGSIFMLLIMLQDGFVKGLVDGIVYGLIIGVLGGVLSGLVPVFTGYDQLHGKSIHWSAKNGAIAGLVAGLLAGLTLGGIFGPIVGIFSGLLFGLFFAFGFGWLAYTRFYIHRFILWRQGSMPWNYVKFLDHCAERNFLRRVGRGYIFIHPLLMMHFKEMTENDIKWYVVDTKDLD